MLIAGLVPAHQSASASNPDEYSSPGTALEVTARSLWAFSGGPSTNGGPSCGQGALCGIKFTLAIRDGWSDYLNTMHEAGVTSLRISLVGCPTTYSGASAEVLTEVQRKTTVTLKCDLSRGHNVSSLDMPIDWEWYYPSASTWAPTEGVVPIAPALPPFTYSPNGVPLIEKSREARPTAWTRNTGVACSTLDGESDKACRLRANFEWVGGAAAAEAYMRANNIRVVRVSIAHACPPGSNDTSVDIARFPTSSGNGFAYTPLARDFGCGFGVYNSIPSLDIGWRVELIDYSGAITTSTQQQSATEALVAAGFLTLSAASTAIITNPESFCAPTLLYRPAGPQFTSIAPEAAAAYQTCLSIARVAGSTAAIVSAGLAVKYGVQAMDRLRLTDYDSSWIDSKPRRVSPTIVPRPIEANPPDFSSGDDDPIVARLLRQRPDLTEANARDVANRCRENVARSPLAMFPRDPSDPLRHPCETEPIFMPGEDLGAATEHKMRSLAVNPQWSQLHYAPGHRESIEGTYGDGTTPPWEPWYYRVPVNSSAYVSIGSEPCVFGGGKHCDEYPYASTAEGGPSAGSDPNDPSTWTGFTLDYISAASNLGEGPKLSAFYQVCNMQAGDSFLVIPTTEAPTDRFCRES